LRVAITGASGLVGSALRRHLAAGGHEVVQLVRKPSTSPATITWDPETGATDPARLEGLDAVVHLAGENIAGGRWNAARKRRIRDSRVHGTQVLASTLARLTRPPAVLACASASGYYGDRGDTVLTEDRPPGQGFLPDVCRAWEAAADPARQAGIRVASLRFGNVLDRDGGMLARLLPLFRWGLGAPLGSGRQFMSWITLPELVRILTWTLTQPLEGAVNAAMGAVTNRDFTRSLNAVLHRPTPPAVPAFILRLGLGEMADALLLASTRMEPARLRAAGYVFQDPLQLEAALRGILATRPRA
jgi:uncharacterized protein (TIGR01777 family)